MNKKTSLWRATLICLIPIAASCSPSPPSGDEAKAAITERLKEGFFHLGKSLKYSQIQSVEIISLTKDPYPYQANVRYNVSVKIKGACEEKGLIGGKRVGSCNFENLSFDVMWETCKWKAYTSLEGALTP